MGIRKKKRAARLLIIGLDGVPIQLLRRYIEDGTMPVLASLFSGAAPVPMTVSLPDVSSVSWSGFMTGRDSGHHGIFGFVDLDPESYAYRFPDFRDLQVPPFFFDLKREKIRSVMVNLPSTYPARPLPGVMVSGFVAPDLKRAIWPPKYLDMAEEMGYMVDVDCSRVREDPDRFFSDLHYSLQQRLAFSVRLMREESWRLFMFTVTGTDRLHHFFFDAFRRGDHPRSADFRGYYAKLDEILGVLLNEAARDGEFQWIVLSDHGFNELRTEVNLNPLLRQWNYGGSEKFETGGISPPVRDSSVFALDPSRVYLNSRERFSNGKVVAGDWERIREDLVHRFLDIEFKGDPVIAAVHRGEDLYGKPLRHLGPDLVLQPFPGFDLKAGFSRKEVFSVGRFSGTHSWDNAFFSCSNPEVIPSSMTIFKARSIIEKLLGVRRSALKQKN